MKQYCRYCSHCFDGGEFRCSNHPKGKQPYWTREQINRLNNCPNFDLSPLGDVESGKMYHPREKRQEDVLEGQISMEEIL